MKAFLKSPYFWVSLALQIVGPYLVTFGNWANVIQWLSGFGMAFAWFEYQQNHKEDMREMKEMLRALHVKHDKLHEKVAKK